MKRKRRPVGRPVTMTARLYIGIVSSQLWLSRGVMNALGNPKRVEVTVEDNLDLIVQPGKDGIRVTCTGYLSASGLIAELELPEKNTQYVARKNRGKKVTLTPQGRKN